MPRQSDLMFFVACLFVAAMIGCAKQPNAQPTAPSRLTSHVQQQQRTSTQPATSNGSQPAPAATIDAAKTPAADEAETPPIELAQAAPPSGRPADISFDDLKLDIEPADRFEDSMLTEQIKSLDGQPIRIRGVMYPTFSKKGNESFILLMNKECKFGSVKDPVWCNIRVMMDEGHTADYTYDPITVEGVLSLDVMKGPKYDLSVYMLTGAKLK